MKRRGEQTSDTKSSKSKPQRRKQQSKRPKQRQRLTLAQLARGTFSLLIYPFWLVYWIISRPYIWVATFLGGYIRAAWAGTERLRRKQKKRAISRLRVWRARLMVRLKFRRPPADAIVAPAVLVDEEDAIPYRRRSPILVTTAISCALILAAATTYIAFINPPSVDNDSAALAAISMTSTPTISPTPTHTPTPTLTPSPTPIILQLTPWPTPDPLSGGGTIAFELRRNGNSDLYALTIGSTDPVRLTADLAPEQDPAWRPDGRMIAYSSQKDGNWDIYVLDMPTGEINRITTQPGYDGNPVWSPDGEWLIYESYQGDNFDLYLIKRDRSEGPIRLTEHPAADIEPAWSPDGRSLVFTSLRTGTKDLFLMSLDDVGDSRAINLTDSFEIDESDAAFHPRGEYLAFTESVDGFDILKALPLAENQPAGEVVALGQGRQPAWASTDDSLIYAYTIGQQDYLIATTLGAWSVAPQTFTAQGKLSDPVWSAVALAPNPAGFLEQIAEQPPLPLFSETYSQTATVDPPYALISVGDDVNTALPFLSSRVDQSFLALKAAVQAQTGIDLLADLSRMFEPLDAQPLPGEPQESWHKAGRAFDLDPELVLAFDAPLEILRREVGGQTEWEVYIRVENQDGSLGEPLRERPWDFRARFGGDPTYYDQGGRYKDNIPTGYYVNFTRLAEDYGWEPVPADRNWRTYYPGVRFWQFEKREDLSWEQAMREIYSGEELGIRDEE